MNTGIRDSLDLFSKLTDSTQERNIYTHRNPIARDIFWRRLEDLLKGMVSVCGSPTRILDFGGGSGAFLKGLANQYAQATIDVVDLDPLDAEALRAHHGLQNVSIFKEDIQKWAPPQPYDIVVATDVLEHFKDLAIPVDAIQRLLKPGGFLCLSLPTENVLYLAGRLLINKQKPLDHYHAARDVADFLEAAGFDTLRAMFSPSYCKVSIPLFRLMILKKGQI